MRTLDSASALACNVLGVTSVLLGEAEESLDSALIWIILVMEVYSQ